MILKKFNRIWSARWRLEINLLLPRVRINTNFASKFKNCMSRQYCNLFSKSHITNLLVELIKKIFLIGITGNITNEYLTGKFTFTKVPYPCLGLFAVYLVIMRQSIEYSTWISLTSFYIIKYEFRTYTLGTYWKRRVF